MTKVAIIGAGARFMWDLLAERKRSEELEDRYSIMLRALQAQAGGDFIFYRRYIPGMDERVKGSDGFSEAKSH
jgi:hypothetical protein